MSHHLHILAAHTGTRIDSAAKHNMACKVDTNLVKALMSETDDSTNLDHRLHVEKMRYCVHKDELVMSTNQKINQSKFSAYPLIVSNVVDIPHTVRARLLLMYAQPTFTDWTDFITAIRQECNASAALIHPHVNNLQSICRAANLYNIVGDVATCDNLPGDAEKRMLREVPVFVPQP